MSRREDSELRTNWRTDPSPRDYYLVAEVLFHLGVDPRNCDQRYVQNAVALLALSFDLAAPFHFSIGEDRGSPTKPAVSPSSHQLSTILNDLKLLGKPEDFGMLPKEAVRFLQEIRKVPPEVLAEMVLLVLQARGVAVFYRKRKPHHRQILETYEEILSRAGIVEVCQQDLQQDQCSHQHRRQEHCSDEHWSNPDPARKRQPLVIPAARAEVRE